MQEVRLDEDDFFFLLKSVFMVYLYKEMFIEVHLFLCSSFCSL